MKLISPYRNVIQYTRISLEPYQMNNDIFDAMCEHASAFLIAIGSS